MAMSKTQREKQRTYNHENSQWEFRKHLILIKDILKIKENLKSLKKISFCLNKSMKIHMTNEKGRKNSYL